MAELGLPNARLKSVASASGTRFLLNRLYSAQTRHISKLNAKRLQMKRQKINCSGKRSQGKAIGKTTGCKVKRGSTLCVPGPVTTPQGISPYSENTPRLHRPTSVLLQGGGHGDGLRRCNTAEMLQSRAWFFSRRTSSGARPWQKLWLRKVFMDRNQQGVSG